MIQGRYDLGGGGYFHMKETGMFLHYRGSVLWNKIPSEIRKLPNLNVFKTSIHGKDFSNTP